MKKKSFTMAFGGIVSAFCVILILLGNIPMGEYLGPTFAGILIAWAVIELGSLHSVWIYAACALLAFLLSSNKEPALLFTLFFGYFPILKFSLQRKIKLNVLRWCIKFAVFNASMAVSYLLLIYVFGMPIEEMQGLGKYSLLILLGGGNVLMLTLDFCIEKLARLYILKWQKKVRKLFGLKYDE